MYVIYVNEFTQAGRLVLSLLAGFIAVGYAIMTYYGWREGSAGDSSNNNDL